MDPSLANDVFLHVRVVMGTIIGLGITRLLTGMAGLIQYPNHYKVSVLHLLWVLSIGIELTLFWWWEFSLSTQPTWNLGVFAFLIFYSATLFALAALLFPEQLFDDELYEEFFIRRRRWFFSIFALTFLFDLVDVIIRGEPYFSQQNVVYFIQIPFGLTLSILAMWTARRDAHIVLVLLHLVYQTGSIIYYFNIT